MCSCRERWYVWCQLTEELLGRWRWNNKTRKTQLKLRTALWLIALQLSSSRPWNRPSHFFTPPGIFNILFMPESCGLFRFECLHVWMFEVPALQSRKIYAQNSPIISCFFTIPLITRQYGAAGQNFKYAFLVPSACFLQESAIPHRTRQKAGFS